MSIMLQDNCDVSLAELCIGSIRQLADTKRIFQEFLLKERDLKMLSKCLSKGLTMSDDWYKHEQEMILYSKIFQINKEAA